MGTSAFLASRVASLLPKTTAHAAAYTCHSYYVDSGQSVCRISICCTSPNNCPIYSQCWPK
jgi:hypothetical protein